MYDDQYGDEFERRVMCDRGQTMTQVGAHQDARFALVISEDDTDTA